MKRAVLIVLVLEGLALVAMVVASRSEGTDAAGRGLATAYLLAFAAPVVLAALVGLPPELRARMRLIHYPDLLDPDAAPICCAREGDCVAP